PTAYILTVERSGILTASQAVSMILGQFPATAYYYAAHYLAIASQADQTAAGILASVEADVATASGANRVAILFSQDLVLGETVAGRAGTLPVQTYIDDLEAAVADGTVTPYQEIVTLLTLVQNDPSALDAVTTALTGNLTNFYLTGGEPEAVAD